MLELPNMACIAKRKQANYGPYIYFVRQMNNSIKLQLASRRYFLSNLIIMYSTSRRHVLNCRKQDHFSQKKADFLSFFLVSFSKPIKIIFPIFY